jgi:hypothetical protein
MPERYGSNEHQVVDFNGKKHTVVPLRNKSGSRSLSGNSISLTIGNYAS